jgi:integrase
LTYLNNGRGTFVIDRRFKGIGRIKRSSGTGDPKTFKLILGMLDTLQEKGRLDLIRGLSEKDYSPLELWERYRGEELERLPTKDSIVPLDPTIYNWIESYKISDRTKNSYRKNTQVLLKYAKSDSTVQDLPEILLGYRKECEKNNHHRTFNHTRSTVQSFLRNTVGKRSNLWGLVTEIDPLSIVRKREGKPQTVKTIKWLIEKLPPKYGEMVWSLCTTGMGWADYSGEWKVYKNYVQIDGTKNKNRVRKVPRIDTPTRPTTTEQYLRKQIKSVTKKDIQLYDFRRTYAHWMEMSGVPRSRRQSYMGHSSRDILDLYESHEVQDHLKKDGDLLREYIKRDSTPEPVSGDSK